LIANSIVSTTVAIKSLLGMKMKQTEPPSCSSNIVLIGKNSRGHWVAQEQSGLLAGVRCQQGFLLSAYRCNFASIAKAA